MRFTPGIHKVVGMSGLLEDLILEGRALFRERIGAEDPEAYTLPDMVGEMSVLDGDDTMSEEEKISRRQQIQDDFFR